MNTEKSRIERKFSVKLKQRKHGLNTRHETIEALSKKLAMAEANKRFPDWVAVDASMARTGV